MLQFATWDRIQELKSLNQIQVTNLAKFLGNLILEKNLAISVLKVYLNKLKLNNLNGFL